MESKRGTLSFMTRFSPLRRLRIVPGGKAFRLLSDFRAQYILHVLTDNLSVVTFQNIARHTIGLFPFCSSSSPGVERSQSPAVALLHIGWYYSLCSLIVSLVLRRRGKSTSCSGRRFFLRVSDSFCFFKGGSVEAIADETRSVETSDLTRTTAI